MLAALHPVSTGIKRRKMKPADAGRQGQAIRKGGRMKYYDNLDELHRHPTVEADGV